MAQHEIRDPIHVFIRLEDDEREVLDSPPFQRLRHIHQLALTFLVYPGATHKRFEHSLGVMELASRIFDVVTHPDNVDEQTVKECPELIDEGKKFYWRTVLRMAALCHDLGHLPFSHAGEEKLLPEGFDHEDLTRGLIQEKMSTIWEEWSPPLVTEDIVKLAVGPAKASDLPDWTTWQYILADIITGGAFGADRMDYLLRDSHYSGVAYGKFDHFRLIDTLRILPMPLEPEEAGSRATEFSLGVELGGLHSAESMLLARYFMFSQVYFHHVRRIYDFHLQDFLQEWLPKRMFSTNLEEHLQLTDNEVTAALLEASRDKQGKGHVHAERILKRRHFKLLYEPKPNDIDVNPSASRAVFKALGCEFGASNFHIDEYPGKNASTHFPVRMRDGEVSSSAGVSDVLTRVPVAKAEYVFVERSIFEQAGTWLRRNQKGIIELEPEQETEDEKQTESKS